MTIQGNLQVTGAKNAVVPMADGQLHRVYSMESPEAWFEDFGEGSLGRGSAVTIPLPTDFGQVADMSRYQVFLSEYGRDQRLFVSSRSATSFTVESASGASGPFGYRIVAKRKDIAAPRLEAFTPPPVRTVRLNTIPPTRPADMAPAVPAAPAETPAPRRP